MEESKFKITKTNVEYYKLRHISRSLWADITIDAVDHTGRIQIASDYGSWQYYWGSCGCPFKQFISTIDIHYAAGKFDASKHFDIDKTLAGLIERAQEYPSDTKEYQESLLAEIETLRDCTDLHEFFRNVTECELIMDMENHSPNIVYTIEPGFLRFWNEIWPELLNQFKNEEI